MKTKRRILSFIALIMTAAVLLGACGNAGVNGETSAGTTTGGSSAAAANGGGGAMTTGSDAVPADDSAAADGGRTDEGGSAATSGGNAATTTGGSSADEGYTLNTLGEFPLVLNGRAEFSILLPWVRPDTHPDNNWGLNTYSEMTGVDIIWQVVPADGWQEKRSVTIASGNLPDYIAATSNFGGAQFTDTEILQYGTQGLFVDIMELLPENSIYLKQILNDNPEWKRQILTRDGKLYAAPDFNVCYHCMYSQRAWINTDWLSSLGLDMPVTTDEFKQTLVAFKEQDANGNGDPNDEIPMSSAIDGWNTQLYGFFMNPFIYSNGQDLINVDPSTDKVYYAPTKDEFREGLRYLNDLYVSGLLDPAAFTQNVDTMKQKNEAGDATIVGVNPDGALPAILGYAVSQRFKEYSVLPPLEGPTGLRQTPYFTSGAGTGLGAITSSAKDPALILRWLDWMYSLEGTIMGDIGQENVNWRPGIAENGEIDFRGNPAKYFTIVNPDVYDFTWTGRFPSNRSKEYRESMSVAGNSLDWRASESGDLELQLFQCAEIYEQYAVDKAEILPKLAIDPDMVTDYTLKKTGINDYFKESFARFVVGDLSLDNDWDSFQQMLSQLGLEDYLAITQEAYDAGK